TLETVSLPSTLTKIGSSAFINNSLSTIVIPDSVTNMGMYAFSGNNLVSAKLPNGITHLQQGVFYRNQLESINIPNSVTTIDMEVFEENALKTIVIPDSVTEMNGAVFAHNNLESVTISKNLKRIAPNSFLENNLKTVVIPEGVEHIMASSFSANQLTSVTIPKTVKIIDNAVFSKNSISSVNISPDSALNSIGALAFSDNLITNINLPNGLTKIGNKAFNNNNLSSLYLPKSLVTIGDSVFEGNKNLATIVYDNSGSETLGVSIFGKPANVVPQFFGNTGNFKTYIESSYEPSYTVYNAPPELTFRKNKGSKDVYTISLSRDIPTLTSTNFKDIQWVVTDSETLNGDEMFQFAGILDAPTFEGLVSLEGEPDGQYYLHVKTTSDFIMGANAPVSITSNTVTPFIHDTIPLRVTTSYTVNEDKTSALVKPIFTKSNLKKVKYAKGKNLPVNYFTSGLNDSQITDITSNTNHQFTVTEGTHYTIYVEDQSGNTTVQTFDTSFIYSTMDNSISIQGYWGSEVDIEIPFTIEGLQVTRIAPNAFQPISESTQLAKGQSTVKLNSVVIPESVTYIGNSAFYKNNLQSITLPQNLK
ncbi:leucine-rich repeat protein, partial [Streptomyces sp. NPDC051130]